MNPLISLTQAKNWLNIGSDQTQDDGLLTLLVSSASDFFGLLTSRDELAPTQYTERLDGSGTNQLIPSNLPILSVISLTVGNITIPVSANYTQAGYYTDGDRVLLVGSGTTFPWLPQGLPQYFPAQRGNVSITYTAGYPNLPITGEAIKVPSTAPYQSTLAQAALFAGKLVLTYANSGTVLTPVASGPSAGQYVLTTSPSLSLTFSAADAGASLLAAYEISNIPLSVQQCVMEMVGWAYKNRDRIGITNQAFSNAGLTNTYSQAPLSPMATATVNRYRRGIARW